MAAPASSEKLSQSWLSTFPIQPLVIPEHQLVALKIVHDALHAPVALDIVHSGAPCSLPLLEHLRPGYTFFVGIVLRHLRGFKQRDGEPPGLENGNGLLDDFGSLETILPARHVGLERRIAAIGFGRHVNREVMSCASALWRRNDSIGREAARREQIGVNPSVGIPRNRINIRQAACVADNGY